MSRLDNIIRLKKWELDEVRRVLADLLGQREAMVRQLEIIDAEIAAQAQGASLEVFATTVGAYMEGVKKRCDVLAEEISAKDEEIAEQQDIVAEGYRELKTFEIAHDLETKRVKTAADREEQQMFDELGTQDHARRDAVTESEYLNLRK